MFLLEITYIHFPGFKISGPQKVFGQVSGTLLNFVAWTFIVLLQIWCWAIKRVPGLSATMTKDEFLFRLFCKTLLVCN